MQAATANDDRLAFAPPPQPGLLRGFGLAVVAHLLLLAALTSGLQWKREATELSAEAELWSALPQQAAPKEVVAPPPPPPPPVVKAPPAPPPPVQREADIALEQQKRKREEEAARREEAERRQAALEREREREKERERKLEAERKEAAERRREEELKKEQQAKLAAEKKRKEEDLRKQRQKEQEERVAKLREENLRRMQGLAGGTGSPSSTGTAARSSGPSGSWAGKVRAKVKPNIVFADDVAGNPAAEVEVRLAPDGTIVGKRLVKPSGHQGWDQAVLRALDRTETLPRDTDGRVHSPVVITFRVRD